MTATLSAAEDLLTTMPHGELHCADVESMLSAQAADNYEMRVRIDSLSAEVEMLRLDRDRLLALHEEIAKKADAVASERDGLADQVKFLGEELLSMEEYTVPQTSISVGTVDRDFLVSTYRTASRITRGPVPPVVVEAVEGATETVKAAMVEAGQAVVADIIKREVRRRRRAQGASGRRR